MPSLALHKRCARFIFLIVKFKREKNNKRIARERERESTSNLNRFESSPNAHKGIGNTDQDTSALLLLSGNCTMHTHF